MLRRRAVVAVMGLHNLGVHSVRGPTRQLCTRQRGLALCEIDDDIFGLTTHQKQLRKKMIGFLQEELAPHADDIDRLDVFDKQKEFWLKLGDMGILGLTADKEYGGSGLGLTEQCIVMEEMTRVSAAMALSTGAQANLCVNQLDRHGTPQQKRRLLPKLCSGEVYGGLAMSEVGSGSDVVSMATRAERVDGGYLLNGSKFWITNGPIADVVLVYAKTDWNCSPQYGITTFIVERGMQGFSTSPKLDKLGNRGSPTGELVFENCFVPDENVLGKVGGGVYVLMSGLDIERLLLAAGPVGIMQAACDITFHHCTNPQQSGLRGEESQLTQGTLADMYCDLNACRSYVYTVARAADRGHISSQECAAVALFCAEKATQVTLRAMQQLGEMGYSNSYPIGRYLRDAKLYEIGGGTSEIRRLVIGRALNAEYK